jgi:hypothetical protein
MLEWGTSLDLGRPARWDANFMGSSVVRDSRSAAIPPSTKRCSRREALGRCRYRCQNVCRRGYLPNWVCHSPRRLPTGRHRPEVRGCRARHRS